MRTPITILLADDHPVYRAGLRQIINEDPAFAVAHETGNGAEALGLLRKHEPRIVILDMDMPGMNSCRHPCESSSSRFRIFLT